MFDWNNGMKEYWNVGYKKLRIVSLHIISAFHHSKRSNKNKGGKLSCLKKKKMSLSPIKIQSFVTSLKKDEVGSVKEMQKSALQKAVIVARAVAALIVRIPAAAPIRAMIAQWKHAAARLIPSAH
jgi:hypothetical protein